MYLRTIYHQRGRENALRNIGILLSNENQVRNVIFIYILSLISFITK